MSAAVAAVRAGLGFGAKAKSKTKKRSHTVEYSLLLTAALCLVAFGVVMVFSASSTTSLLGESGDGAYYLKRTLMYGAIGLLVLRLLSVAKLARLRALIPLLLGASVVMLLMIKLPGIGMEAKGATRWIGAGPIQIQPSEIAKVALVLYGAHMIAARPKLTADIRSMAPYLLVAAGVVALIVVEPDLGSAMVSAFSVAALLIAGGAKIRHLVLIGAALCLIALIAILMEPYRQERLFSFFNPDADVTGAGHQVTQARIAMGSGGLFGVGLGESVQKAFYLPEAHTDMIAAVIGEETGLAGLGILVSLYMMLGYAGFQIARRAKDRFGRLLAAGLTAMILIQATINLFAVTGMAPLTGVTLPFVSYGNSSLIMTLAAIGLLLNVAAGGTAANARTRTSARPLRVLDGGGSRRTATASNRHSGGARATSGDRGRRDSRTRSSGARRSRRA